MTNSRNCTCQQSSVNRPDQRNMSMKHEANRKVWLDGHAGVGGTARGPAIEGVFRPGQYADH